MTAHEPRLQPPQADGRTSAVRIPDAWYVACRARSLGPKPIAVTVLGIPLVLFRGADGRPAALLDRCPHRNVPLSMGAVDGDCLRCAYHGWAFAGDGACKDVPGLLSPRHETRGRRVPAFATVEQDGLVWVYATPDEEPPEGPYQVPYVGAPGYHTVHDEYETAGTLHAVAENALDVPHTAFLHRGLFRGAGKTNEIEVLLRRHPDRVEAQYVGEPAPTGLVGRLLAPGGGVVTHFDRFLLPCIAQVEYALGDRSHVVVTSALTPISDDRTRLFAVVTFKLPLPAWLVAAVVKPVGRRIFAQDAAMLARQADNIRRFGGERYVSTEIDVLGPHILHLLRRAEKGRDQAAEEPFERRFTMRA